jgi:hypothetical protein
MLPTPGVHLSGRQLAWSTPQLWSTISFTLPKLPKRKNLKTLLFINDWLQCSRSLPLDLWVYDYGGDKCPISREQYGQITDALNQPSGRWHALYLRVTKPAFFRLFGGTCPSNIRTLQLITDFDQRESPTFIMNSRPSPTHLSDFSKTSHCHISTSCGTISNISRHRTRISTSTDAWILCNEHLS